MSSKRIYPKVLSLFTGCGGLDLGFHLEGYKTIWANDFEHSACETFRNNFGDVIIEKNIEEIDANARSIPDCDIILGGFPCQDFSMVWKQPGLQGKRGNLYKSFLRFVEAKKPKAFVAENVKGILTANKGKAIRQILQDFENIAPGYIVKPKLYNFADYGVPQFRERVLIVGVRIDTGFQFEHPLPTHGPKAGLKYYTAGEALIGLPDNVTNNERINITDRTRQILDKIPEGGNFTSISPDDPLYVKGMISHVYRRINRNEPSKTIIAAGGGGTWGYHFPEPRPLTNRERARIQSFPDDFVFWGSIAEVRKQIGNAVPPEGVRALAKQLLPIFTGQYDSIDLNQKQKEILLKDLSERIDLITA